MENTENKFNSPFYQDNPKKVFYLSLITGGGYQLLWEYRHWKYLKRRAIYCLTNNKQDNQFINQDAKINVFFRITINLFSIFILSKRVKNNIKSNKSNFLINPYFMLVVEFSSIFFVQPAELVDQNNLLISFLKTLINLLIIALTSFQLAFLQKKANALDFECNNSSLILKKGLNKWDIIYLIIGILYSSLFLLAIIANTSNLISLLFFD